MAEHEHEAHEHEHDHNSHLFVMLIFNFAQLAMVNLGKIANPEKRKSTSRAPATSSIPSSC